MIAYSNKNYTVETNDEKGEGYLIRNNATQMVECIIPYLPVAINNADELDKGLDEIAATKAREKGPGERILSAH